MTAVLILNFTRKFLPGFDSAQPDKNFETLRLLKSLWSMLRTMNKWFLQTQCFIINVTLSAVEG